MTSVSKSIHLGDARVALILNAKSGKKDGEARVEELVENIRGSVRGLSVRPVRQGSELIPTVKSAIDQGTDIIAAFGGDGTQAAVAGVVAGSGVAMAVLPGGTFNYFARELGVDTIESALDALRTGEIAERDVGRINDRVFINNASVGLYPQILQNREDIYKRWGRSRIAAYWSVLVGLRDLTSPMRLRVSTHNGTQEIVTPLAFAARSAYQLESLGLDGAHAVRDGKFALFLSKGQTRRALLASSLRLALGRTTRGEDFDIIEADSIMIESRKKQRLVALDGEKVHMASPLKLEVLRGALRVFVPSGKRPAIEGITDGMQVNGVA